MPIPFDIAEDAKLVAKMEPRGIAMAYTADQLDQMATYAVRQIANPAIDIEEGLRWECALDNIIDALDMQKRAVA